MAARAHDVAALAIKGKSAVLNFPHLADRLPRPTSACRKEIQVAAAEAAAATIFDTVDRSRAEPASSSEHSNSMTENELFDLPELTATAMDVFFDLPDLFEDDGMAGVVGDGVLSNLRYGSAWQLVGTESDAYWVDDPILGVIMGKYAFATQKLGDLSVTPCCANVLFLSFSKHDSSPRLQLALNHLVGQDCFGILHNQTSIYVR